MGRFPTPVEIEVCQRLLTRTFDGRITELAWVRMRAGDGRDRGNDDADVAVEPILQSEHADAVGILEIGLPFDLADGMGRRKVVASLWKSVHGDVFVSVDDELWSRHQVQLCCMTKRRQVQKTAGV